MEERSRHLTVVIGASSLAEELRRKLVRRKVAHAGITTHLRGLRRSMAMGQNELVIICIALDRSTIERHGEAVRRLLADCQCFPQSIRSVGLLTNVGLTPAVAEIGCDVYAHNSQEAARAVKLLAKNYRSRELAISRFADQSSRCTWAWGEPHCSLEMAVAEQTQRKLRPESSLKNVRSNRRLDVGRPSSSGGSQRSRRFRSGGSDRD